MSDLIERLRGLSELPTVPRVVSFLMFEAAARIAELEAAVADEVVEEARRRMTSDAEASGDGRELAEAQAFASKLRAAFRKLEARAVPEGWEVGVLFDIGKEGYEVAQVMNADGEWWWVNTAIPGWAGKPGHPTWQAALAAAEAAKGEANETR